MGLKYADYAQRHQETSGVELEQEIDESQKQTEERRSEDTVPERFKGKSREDIANSFVELESRFGQQGNELGSLRRTVNELVEKQNRVPEPTPPAPKPVTMDELYETPDAAMRRVAREEGASQSSKVAELERDLQQAKTQVAIADARRVFEQKHPNFKDTLKDPGFKEWIGGSNMRLTLAQAADQGNFDAADELFSTYTELKQLKTQRPAVRSEAARSVSLERSGGVSPAPEETFSRVGLQEKRIAAQRGDRAAARWLVANGPAIQEAYAEGRLTT